MKKFLLSIALFPYLLFSCNSTREIINTNSPQSNSNYWQQHADYTMSIDMDVNTFKYRGFQKVVYSNNSPDELNKVYYHLYFNAFRPGSEMDIRSRTIADPDPRVGDRISKLSSEEIGYIKVSSLKQNGQDVQYKTIGTILEVSLNNPIQPGESVTFDMVFNAQVPLQIRRSGRNNKEGVDLSMTQWYPKLAEYDFEGWHANQYIGREFHGVWGNFDVTLTIDKNYVVGGTGYLQGDPVVSGNKKTFHFKAPKVHDFTWAADPDYIHDTLQVPDGPLLNFYYLKTLPEENLKYWKELQPKTLELMQYFNTHIGDYPYEQYSVIQGGDGGMEYAMCTLITGERSFGSLVGVTAHELAHSWFQFVLATNESKHEWMDEGFTSYISDYAMNEVMDQNKENPTSNAYLGYIYLAKSGKEQPLTTHADRYEFNQAYGISAYSKGEVFMAQLGYVIGEDNLAKTIKQYYSDWAFKHPTPNDFIRVAEKVSGFELDWYLTDFAQTTNTIDYAVKSIDGKSATLERIGLMAMPLDVTVTFIDDSTENYLIPLRMMMGHKPTSATVTEDWPWSFPIFTLEMEKEIKSVSIDPSQKMADVDKSNNTK